MSWQALAKVSDRILGSPARKAVVIVLANHANIDSELTFPSVFRIAGESELAESTVRGVLSWLRDQSLIIQVAGPAQHKPATYRLNYEAFSALQQVEVCRPEVHQVAPDLQETEPRPPAGGPEQFLTVPNHVGERGNQDPWIQVLIQLKHELASRGMVAPEYGRYIEPTWLRSIDAGTATIICEGSDPESQVAWLADRLARRCARMLMCDAVRFVVAANVAT